MPFLEDSGIESEDKTSLLMEDSEPVKLNFFFFFFFFFTLLIKYLFMPKMLLFQVAAIQ